MKYAKNFKLYEAKDKNTQEVSKSNADAMNKFIKAHGIKAKPIKPGTIDSTFKDLDTVKIDTKTLGAFRVAIKDMEVEIKYGKHDQTNSIFIMFQFNYNHWSGSNGYRTTFVSDDDGKTWRHRDMYKDDPNSIYKI